MITVILPDSRDTSIKVLKHMAEVTGKRVREHLIERVKLIEYLKDFKDIANLPEDHAVCALLRAEYED